MVVIVKKVFGVVLFIIAIRIIIGKKSGELMVEKDTSFIYIQYLRNIKEGCSDKDFCNSGNRDKS